MGEVEFLAESNQLLVHSHIICYGGAASDAATERIRAEIEGMWNEPEGVAFIKGKPFRVQFQITAACQPGLDQMDVLQNTNPRNNYFRIEDFIHGNISFVDGLGCNTGFFLLENLYEGSTTAAHEYGHTLGLDHPHFLDIRGQGVPGIMYPRGTLVDPQYQYDPTKPAGVTGGTMHPMHRKVKQEDIEHIRWSRLRFNNGKAVLGAFTNIFHWPHPRAK